MKLAPVFGLLAIAGLAASGCSGTVPPASSVSAPAAAPAAQGCHGGPHCGPLIVAPLKYDGTSFSEVPVKSCAHVVLTSGHKYRAKTTGPLTLGGPISLAPECVPSTVPPATQLFIVAFQIGGHFGGGHAQAPDDNGIIFAGLVGGPAQWTDNPWVFQPVSPAVYLKAKRDYVFYVAALRAMSPSPSPTPYGSPTPTPYGSPTPSSSPTSAAR